MQKISIAVPTYNSSRFILDTFTKVIKDKRVDEIVIHDDASSDFDELTQKLLSFDSSKIKIFRNEKNLKAFENKALAVEKCRSEWVVLLDSDNAITTKYLDTIYKQEWQNDTILCPEFAKPLHNYKRFAGTVVSKVNLQKLLAREKFPAFLNTGNFFLNRQEYLDVFKKIPKDNYLSILDAIYFTINWIQQNKKLKVVAGLNYFHRQRSDSFFMVNKDKSTDINQKIVSSITGNQNRKEASSGIFQILIFKMKSFLILTYYYIYEKMKFFRIKF